jgi:hypothetical protein
MERAALSLTENAVPTALSRITACRGHHASLCDTFSAYYQGMLNVASELSIVLPRSHVVYEIAHAVQRGSDNVPSPEVLRSILSDISNPEAQVRLELHSLKNAKDARTKQGRIRKIVELAQPDPESLLHPAAASGSWP